MGHKVFVSYKYADNNVKQLADRWGHVWGDTTARTYVNELERYIKNTRELIYKGERDGDDLSYLTEAAIWEKLKDRIYDSSITILFISPNMKEPYKHEKSQWIPWEISYSLKEMPRRNRTSHSNAILAVVLPDRANSYSYYSSMRHFNIVQANIDNGYIQVVHWNDFINNVDYYVELAQWRKEQTAPNEVVKSL